MANILEKIINKSRVIEPPKYNLIQFKSKNNGYEIFTKDKYLEYQLSRLKPADINKEKIKFFKNHFDKISKEYNFIIGVGEGSKMFYEVEFFNQYVIGK